MLNSDQLQKLHRALLGAFNPGEFEALVRNDIGAPLERFVRPGTEANARVFELIQSAERAGWTNDLVRAAYTARPQNRQLAEIYGSIGLGTSLHVLGGSPEATEQVQTTDDSLERIIGGDVTSVGVDHWLQYLQRIHAQVCRIELNGSFVASGFLVGPDLVLTCHYVVQQVIEGTLRPTAIRVRFDYGADALVPGTVSEGLLVPLTEQDWLVDWSPPQASELKGGPGTPNEDELDHAVLRLARRIGDEPAPGSQRQMRGWIDLEFAEAAAPEMPVLIAQYPNGGPLNLSLSNPGVIDVNANGTRVRYRNSTEPGSAGAPCFKERWELIAMHHASEGAGGTGAGIGVTAIALRDRFRRRGLASDTLSQAPTEFTGGAVIAPPEPADVIHEDDPQKNRWGGLAKRDGLTLKIKLRDAGRSLFTFDAVVESDNGFALQPPVIFHLHDSYPRSPIRIRRIRDGRRAILEDVSSYGVYTIGVQARRADGNWTSLEYDLAKLPKLPKLFKGR